MKELKTLVVLCGGTGGHFFPGLSVAREFKKQNGSAVLITGKHKVNYAKDFSSKYELPIYEVSSSVISASPLKLIRFAICTAAGYFQSLKILLKYRPDAVLAMGSYTSLPAAMASVTLGIPLFLHDGNSVIGKANCFLSRWAKALMSAFPPVNRGFDLSKVVVTGMPLRQELTSCCNLGKEEVFKSLNKMFNKNFSGDRPTLLVFGGSLGAMKINTAVPESVKDINIANLQIIHITGKGQLETTATRYAGTGTDILILEKSDEMALLYSAADLVICRSGGSTVAELEYFNKNSILIPYPLAAENHQYYNALYLCRQNQNTVIIEDKDLTPEKLRDGIKSLIANQHKDNRSNENPAVRVLSLIRSMTN